MRNLNDSALNETPPDDNIPQKKMEQMQGQHIRPALAPQKQNLIVKKSVTVHESQHHQKIPATW
ncbi:MAG: hypothetical protein LUG47_09800 [Clostridiales bacterium]|nr:hypothetical protein [Clostridiales bacterium]